MKDLEFQPKGRRESGSLWRPSFGIPCIAFGLYLAVAPAWTPGAPAGWFIPLGLVLVLVVLAPLHGPRLGPIIGIAIGLLIVASPWLGGYAESGWPAQTALVVGFLAVGIATTEVLRTF